MLQLPTALILVDEANLTYIVCRNGISKRRKDSGYQEIWSLRF